MNPAPQPPEAVLVWRWAVRVWRGSLPMLAGIVALTFGSSALITLLPWLWQFLVDAVRTDADPVGLQELAFWMAIVGLGHAVLYLLLQCARAWMNCRIEWRAREAVFDHLTTLGPSFWRRWRSGDLVTRLYDDAGEKIAWFLCSGIFRAFEAVTVIAACLGAMLWLDPWVTMWTVLPLPLLIVGQALTQGALGRRYGRVQETISTINDELSTTFGGIRIVQACGLAPAARSRFLAATAAQRDAEVSATVVQQGMFLMYGYGWQLTVVALLLAGGPRVVDGTLSLGQYVTLEGLVMTLVWPMFDLGTFLSKYKQAGVALKRLQELLDEAPPDAVPPEIPVDAGLAAHDLRVTADDALLLDGVALTAAPGETVAIVGEVGAGKSQLMAALGGAIRPSAGTVRLGGARIEAVAPSARAAAVATVPQDPVLLSASLKDNILLGRDVSREDLQHALTVSRLHQDMPAFPQGLDTLVGERGVTLSGGQQQRVALARALVGRPQVLLLDDATAALDADTEAAFWEGLATALPDVTTVVVTHRVATLQRAGRVVVLEGGQVAQSGTHADLITLEGPYRRIYGRFEALDRVGA